MIFVDYSGFTPNKEWRKRARKKLFEMIVLFNEGKTVELKKMIKDGSGFWGEIKGEIIDHTYNKCWFSEGTSDVYAYAIEHFRPKKKVTLIDDPYPEARKVQCDSGYWWLTFDFKNYRIVGGIPNSSKSNFFPLEENSFIQRDYRGEITDEVPMLLDPTIKGDVELLSYNLLGAPESTYTLAANPLAYNRAMLTIKYYNLNRNKTLTDARSAYLVHINKGIGRVEEYYNDWQADITNKVTEKHFTQACQDLLMLADPAMKFSSMVKNVISFMPQPWAKIFLIDLLP